MPKVDSEKLSINTSSIVIFIKITRGDTIKTFYTNMAWAPINQNTLSCKLVTVEILVEYRLITVKSVSRGGGWNRRNKAGECCFSSEACLYYLIFFNYVHLDRNFKILNFKVAHFHLHYVEDFQSDFLPLLNVFLTVII